MELGSFFSNCDGDFDDREAKFLDNYIDNMIASDQEQREELEEIKNGINKMPNIEYLIMETKRMKDAVEEQEKVPLLKTLSYLINEIIIADGILHLKEARSYTEWKNALELDDDINIDDYLK